MKKQLCFFIALCMTAGLINSQTMVRLKLPNNCNASTGVENTVLANENPMLELFPNPNGGNFTLIISLKDNIDKATIRVYDMTGKAIYIETVFSNSNKLVKQLKIANLKKGTYLFEVKNTRQTSSTKLVINK